MMHASGNDANRRLHLDDLHVGQRIVDKIWIELRPDFGVKGVWVVEDHPQMVAESRHCYYLHSDTRNGYHRAA